MQVDVLMQTQRRSPLRVSVIFALGIILPSAFLSFLGLRSYRYEGRLNQKETEERFAAVADLIDRKIDARLGDLQGDLRSIVKQTSFQRLERGPMLSTLLGNPRLDSIPIDTLCIFDETDRMVVPWHSDGAATPPTMGRQELDWGSLSDEIERLERLEFIQKDYKGALAGYRALESENLPPPLQAALRKNIAGDYRKLKQYDPAAAIYQKLARDYDALMDFSGYPLGIIGRQLAIPLYEENKAWGSAIDTRLDLWEGLLMNRWTLPDAKRNALITEQTDGINMLSKKLRVEGTERGNRWVRLRNLQERLQRLAHEGERFAKTDWPDLIQRVRRQRKLEQGGVFQLGSPTAQRMAIVTPVLSLSGNRRGTAVAVLAADRVRSLIDDVARELSGTAGLKAEWGKRSSSLTSPEQLWTSRLEREIDAIDPPLQLRLIDTSSSLRDQMYRRRQWIFGGMIAMSILIMVAGLVVMNQAMRRETELANLKSDFVANVSHELRTPLAAISHIGERLSLGRYRSDVERKEYYDLLGQETGRLRHLIEDILDFSKMLAGKKVYGHDPLDLAEIAELCVKRFTPKADAQGFEIRSVIPQDPVMILGDTRALEQATLNLLDNAMKYSGESHLLEVAMTQTQTDARLAITDHGIGMANSDLGKIFEKFYRLQKPGRTQDAGGVGLGLAMVKHVVEGHNGKIEVESQLGKGTTFTLVFPLHSNGGHNGTHSIG